MIRITAYDAAGTTDGFSYVVGDWRLASETTTKWTWTGRILTGTFAGSTLLEEWLGTFNLTSGTGLVREARQIVGNALHFSAVLDTPIRTDHFDADFDSAAAKGIEFIGSRFNNGFAGYLGSDKIYGYAGNDYLFGDGGSDYIHGGTSFDWMEGGVGNDAYVVDNSKDRTFEVAGEGTDRVIGLISFALQANVENLTLTGTAAINGTGNTLANAITGNAASNILKGLGGNDTLNGAAGADRMEGGLGNDVYVRDNAGDVIVELAGQGTDRVNSSLSYSLPVSVENLTLTGTAATNGTGNILANVVTGNAASNILKGLGGNDTLNGAAGADRMEGGLGNDVYVRDNAGDVIEELAGQGTDRVNSSLSYSLPVSVENLTLTGTAATNGTGNTLANVVTGNAASNILSGGLGADRMVGGLGNDVYVRDNPADVIVELASQGTDQVNSSLSYRLPINVENLTLTGTAAASGTGNTLSNVITGNAASNILSGGLGADRMVGGLGSDYFVFSSISESVPGVARDIIEDFEHGTDKVDLLQIDADPGSPSDDPFAFIGASPFTGTPGELRYSEGVISGDVNGDTVADLEIEIANLAAMTIDDFVL